MGKRKDKAGKAKGGGEDAGVLYCPQCGERRAFVWDPYLAVCRCPDCGATTENFYVRKENSLWEPPGRKEAVERAIRASGREWPRPKKAEEASAPPPDDDGPGEAKLAAWGYVRIGCSCGRVFWAGEGKASCPGCLKRYDVREGGAEPLGDRALRCGRCGSLVVGNPEKGRAYLCLRCGAWAHAPGDEEGERQALRGEKEAAAWRKARPVKDGRLKKPVLDRVKNLAARECCNYSGVGPYRAKNWCWPKDGPCAFFAPPEGAAPHRCSWFEEAVIAAEEHAALMAEYERAREEPPVALAACAEPVPAGKAARPCERCGEPFVPVLPWQTTCPGGCRNGGPADTLSYDTEGR
ncbi:MAG: hypothetical protein H5T97_08845 [Firmicutes bacterium]|nr:hypothetical protein [Bacillota bacterium]